MVRPRLAGPLAARSGAGAFDAVVVGGGTAGCVVAARLAESPARSVLLVEAGPDRRADTPGALRDGWQITRDFDWGYASEPDRRGDVQKVRRNRLLGGTSWVTRFALRGSPADYDEWGNAGWTFDNVLPYFKRLEADADYGDAAWHGDRGPIPVCRYRDREYTEMVAAAEQALARGGFATVEDHNRPGAVGAGRMPMSSRGGRRVTTADAYLPLAANLTIRADTHVAEVVFEGDRAVGVRLLDGTVIEAGRVVLSAGVFGTPAILMRSGIGPADGLRSLGVPVRVDLPAVGENLADHPAVTLECGYGGPARTDPLHLVATFHSAGRSSDLAPDLMLWLADPEEPDCFEIDAVLLKPRSRGRVRLRSADPMDPPRIELPSLDEPLDAERLGQAYRRALDVAADAALRPHGHEPRAEGELRDLVRREAYSLPHLAGTCAMGAVGDARGRVHGVEGLSVVDASIMPDVPSGFTHLPTIMLAERLAADGEQRF